LADPAVRKADVVTDEAERAYATILGAGNSAPRPSVTDLGMRTLAEAPTGCTSG